MKTLLRLRNIALISCSFILLPFLGNAQAPTTPPSNLSITNVDGNQFRVAYTIGNGAQRLIIAKEGSEPTTLPSDGTDYVSGNFGAGNEIAPGEFVVYEGTSSAAYIYGLNHSKEYFFRIYEFNGTNSSTQYLTSSYLPGSQTTLTYPTSQASFATTPFTNVLGSSMRVNFNSGDGSGRILVARANEPVNADPQDLINYNSHGSAFGNASYQMGTGNYVLYQGNGNYVDIWNLQPNTTYHFALFEYNGSSGKVYLSASSETNPIPGATESQITVASPTLNATNMSFSNIDGNRFYAYFTKGNGTSRIIVAKKDAAVDAVPVDGTDYIHDTTFGTANTELGTGSGNFVVYDGTSNQSWIYGLEPNTTYHFKVFEYYGSGNETFYLKTDDSATPTPNPILTGNQTTVTYPTSQASFATTPFTNVLGSSMRVNFNSGDGSGRILVARANEPVNADPQDLINYNSHGSAFGNVSYQMGTGNYVLYQGNGNYVDIWNLQPNTTYHFALFEYNGSSGKVYLSASSETNPIAGATESQITVASPTLNATNMSFSNIDGNRFYSYFTKGNGTSRIIVAKKDAAVDAVPVDGTDYIHDTTFGTANTELGTGSGNFVVYDGTSNQSWIYGLEPNTTYHFKVFEYYGSGNETFYLKTDDSATPTPNPVLTGNQTTVTYPTSQASFATTPFTNVLGSSMRVNFNSGDGSGRILVARANEPVNADPQDLINYNSHGSAFGNASYQMGTGNYVLYQGNGNYVDIWNLQPNTTYHFALFEYNGSSGKVYLSASSETNPIAGATESQITKTTPTLNATNMSFSNIDGNRFYAYFTKGNGTSRIIVAKKDAAVDAVPVDGTDYIHDTTFGSANTELVTGSGNFVVYDGTSNQSWIYGLEPNTTYHFKVFEYYGSGNETYYLVGDDTAVPTPNPVLENFQQTISTPTTQAGSVFVNSKTTTSFNINWTNGTGSGRILLARANDPVNAEPQDLINYSQFSGGYGNASYEIGSGNYLIYSGSSNSDVIYNLQPGTNYHFSLFEYNGSNGKVYLRPGYTFEAETYGERPTNQVSSALFENVGASSMLVKFNRGNGSHRIVLAKEGSAVDASLSDFITYNPSGSFGLGEEVGTGNFVVYNGTDNEFILDNLNVGTTYHFAFFEYAVNQNGELYLSPAYTVSKATASPPSLLPTNLTVSPPCDNAVNVSWDVDILNPNKGDGRLVVLSEEPLNALPIDKTDYTALFNYGEGSAIGNGFVIYKGSGDEVPPNLLEPFTNYYINLFEYNGINTDPAFNTTPLQGLIGDDTPPIMVCQDLTIQLDANGMVSIIAADVDNGSTDNCGIETLALDITDFNCSNIGTNTVRLTATDFYGNSSFCDVTVTVEDKIVPVLTNVADKTELLDANCNFSIPDYTDQTNATDNCGTTTVTQSPASGTVIAGDGTTQLITLTADDGNGNTAQTTFTVTLDDKIVPVLTNVADKTELLDASCNFSIPDYTDQTNATDNCGTPIITQTPASGTVIAGDGTTQLITLTADDGNGNTAQTTFTVTLDDKIVPVLTNVADKTELLDANCNFSIPDYTDQTNATDNCGTTTVTQSPASGTVIAGDGTTQLITLTADDGNGNTAQTTFTVTLDDKIVPVLTNVADKTELLDASCNFSIPDYTDQTNATDNCGTTTVTQSPASGTVIAGDGTTQLITLTADDGNGNTAQTTFTVTLDDKIVPVLTNVADKTELLDASCNFSIPDYTDQTNATDNCGTPTITQTPVSGTVIAGHGTTQLITLTADDGNGNTAQTTFTVTLDDKIVPVLTNVADKTELLDANCNFSIPDYTDQTNATDNCGTTTVTQSPASGTVIAGDGTTQLITLTADDGNGNTAQTTFTVTLDDKIVPVLTNVADKTELLDASCNFSIPDYTDQTNATDNCGTPIITQTPASGTVIAGDGTTQLITLTADDGNGNTAQTTFTVTLDDKIVPVLTNVADKTELLDANCNFSIPDYTDQTNATDNCGTTTVTQSPASGTVIAGDGTTQLITLTADDGNGNTAQTTFTVTLDDKIVPVLTNVADKTELLDASCNFSIPDYTDQTNATDNCGTPIITQTPASGTVIAGDGTTQLITLTADDGNGNTAQTTFTVTLDDKIVPVLTNVADKTELLDASCNFSIPDYTDQTNATDNCGTPTITQTPVSGTVIAGHGTTQLITLTADDGNGNTAQTTFTVTLDDKIVPVLTNVADKTELLDANCNFSIPDYTDQTNATDNCGTTTVTQSPASGTVIAGDGTTQLITLTADDGNGNTAQTTFTVTLDDKIVPVLTNVADKTELLDASCNFSIPDYTDQTNATDNCGTPIITQTPASGTVIAGDGTTQLITLTADDGNGNTAQTTFTVTLDDKIVPVLTNVADKTELLDANCNFSIPDYTDQTNATDNCGTTTVTQSPASGTVIAGDGTTQLITLTADDGNGNTAQTTFTVTLDDKIVPVLTNVADKTELLDANCNFSIPDYTDQTNATDNCGTTTVTQSPASGTVIAGDGTTQLITLTADDGNGNTAQTTFTVTLDDKIVPVLTNVADKTELLDASCNFSIPDYTDQTNATDNCGTPIITQTPASGTVIAGDGTTQLITLTADDGNGNTAQTTFTVTLDDKIVPVLTNVADKTELLDANCNFSIPDYTDQTNATDNCGTTTVTQSPASGTVIAGDGTTQLITLTADDGNGNTAQTTFTVTLDDKIVPVLTNVADKTELLDASCNFSIPDYTDQTNATDNCGTPIITQTPASGTVIAGDGTTQLITLTADDGNGNTAQTTFTVTLDDKIVPVLTNVADKTELLDANCNFSIPDYTDQTNATDNCGTTTVTQSPASGTVIAGDGTTQLITLTADDGNGNTAQTTFTVTLQGNLVTYYLDTDQDGYGIDDPQTNVDSCGNPGAGYSTQFGDNCPNTYNPDQLDNDNDGIGNLCDDCIDVDQDGVCADVDCDDQDETVTTSSDNDTDNDGVNDCNDQEINSPCPNNVDANGVSLDSDNDGVLDCFDICPGFDDNIDTDNDGTPDGCDTCDDSVDTDNDGINDCNDQEINSPCPDNVDANGVSLDSDNDGVLDCFDICPGFDDTIDSDGDGTPDGCDTCDDSVDTDNDGINDCNDLEINSPCPDNVDANGVSLDSDNDGVLDCFDICPGFDDTIDSDGDGTPDGCDTCDDSVDTDNDGINDCNDLEINSPCPDNVDANGVSLDSDNDGVLDCFDICPGFDDTIDSDGDGTPDGCDTCDDSVDTDNDGINDCNDLEINSPCPDNVDANGVSLDSDNDGVLDCFDICPGFDDTIDSDGDGTPDGCDTCDDSVDTDNDGINDCNDQEINSPCPDNVDANGVSLDSDNDGVLDCFDICPGFDDTIDSDGDGTPDGCDTCDDSVDTDNDGINDCNDQEINSPCPDNVDANGVSLDSDNDGVLDCFDICPGFDDTIDSDGDGTPDGCDTCDDSVDTDNDGINDCNDLEINSPCPDNVDANGVSLDSDNDGVLDCFDICPGFDDTIDSDGDGTPDGCDTCDDSVDTDNDGINDCNDQEINSPCPDNVDANGVSLDSDNDGVLDCFDICPGFDDTIDSDGDGTPDGCDTCDDSVDTDNDGVNDCNDQEINSPCPNNVDANGVSLDSDNDGVLDCFDICPGFDDTIDSDDDGTPDGCDNICVEYTDNFAMNPLTHSGANSNSITYTLPSDSQDVSFTINDIGQKLNGKKGNTYIEKVVVTYVDELNTIQPYGTFNGNNTNSVFIEILGEVQSITVSLSDGEIDANSGSSNMSISFSPVTYCINNAQCDSDSDNDGVCDDLDICPNSDDSLDADNDGTPDGCDTCPNSATGDSDNDGVCDDLDICPGFDDTIDTDEDGIPDGCDLCPNDANNNCNSNPCGPELYLICHIKNNGDTQELCVSAKQRDRHLAHGDYDGSCSELNIQRRLNIHNIITEVIMVKVYPNPSDTDFSIKITSKNTTDVVTISVFDMSNKLVHSDEFKPDQVHKFGNKLEGGVYIVKVSQGDKVKTVRLVKY